MGLLDRARNLLRSPADRRLEDMAREAWGSVPQPSTSLVVTAQDWGMSQPPARPPPIDYMRDAPPPPPSVYARRQDFGTNYQNFAAPLGFEGFGRARIRSAVALHRLGNFYETCALVVAVMGFAPVLAALKQRVAPMMGLERHVKGGDKGIAKFLRAETERRLVPRAGLLPSPYLTPQFWGTLAGLLAFFSFAVLQHVDGEPDPETGVRPRWTRVWPTWALQWTRTPRKLVALTTQGPVEVLNDGKFTLVANTEEPYLESPILALGEEVLDGRLTRQQRQSWQNFFGNPKLWGTPPQGVPTHGPGGGDAFQMMIDVLYGPEGRGVLPAGSKLDAVSITGEGSKAFSDGDAAAIAAIFMVLTGSTGTIGNAGSVIYQPAKSGSWNVRHDLIAEDTLAACRGLNQGDIWYWLRGNYGDAIDGAERAGTWKDPVLSMPLPQPDQDERVESLIAREDARTRIIEKRRANGIRIDQDEADKIAEGLCLPAVPLEARLPRIQITDTDRAKAYRVAEVRAGDGYDKLGDERDDLTIAELDALAKQKAATTQPGTLTTAEGAPDAAASPASTEPPAPAP